MSGPHPDRTWSDAGRYEIRLQGHLDARWSAWFDGLALTHVHDGTTVLHAAIADQSALHGLLRKVNDIGVPLVSVTRTHPVVSTHHWTPAKEHDMTTDSTIPTTKLRRIALAGGLLYLITFAASIPELKLYAGVIDNPAAYISTSGGNSSLLWGALFEIITAIASIGTAVALYPVNKRVSPAAAIGFVTSRVVEGVLIVVGVISLLSVVTLRGDFAGATGAQKDALEMTGHALVALRQWTFLLGPGLIPGINALFLGYVMYRSRLVPRIIPIIGLVGAPLLIMSAIATMFGGWSQVSTAGALCALPIAAWEFSLGMWLTVKGFRVSATESVPAAGVAEPLPAR